MTAYYSKHRNGQPFIKPSGVYQPIDTFAGSLREWSAYTAFERRDVTREMQRGRCFLCGGELTTERLPMADPHAVTDDHILPKASGGGWPWILPLAHRACNLAKANRPPHPCELLLLASVNFELRWRIAED